MQHARSTFTTLFATALIAIGGAAHADVADSVTVLPVPASLSTTGGAFSANKAVAVNQLNGAVSNVAVRGIGNVASTTGSGNGGGSAQGGTGNGGNGSGGAGSGASGASESGTGGAASGSANGQGNGASGSGGGTGGAGAAGSNTVNAGSFSMSNTMTGTASSASGIVVVSQNTGMAALTQQSVNVQASFGTGK
jgi:hypothetical protein